MNVMWSMLNQERGKLQKIYPERIQHISLFFRIKYLVPGMIKEERRKVKRKKIIKLGGERERTNFIIHKSEVLGFCFLSSF